MAHYLSEHQALARLLTDFAAFSRTCYPASALRRYQLEAAVPILAALDERRNPGTPLDPPAARATLAAPCPSARRTLRLWC